MNLCDSQAGDSVLRLTQVRLESFPQFNIIPIINEKEIKFRNTMASFINLKKYQKK